MGVFLLGFEGNQVQAPMTKGIEFNLQWLIVFFPGTPPQMEAGVLLFWSESQMFCEPRECEPSRVFTDRPFEVGV